MVIIGLAGQAGAGKDTVADYLEQRYGFIKFAFADALYLQVQNAYGLEDQSLLRDRVTKEVATEQLALKHCQNKEFEAVATRIMDEYANANGYDKFLAPWGQPQSPRRILQWWGTDYRRAQQDTYWIEQAALMVNRTHMLMPYPELRPQYFVETGTRFENEREWLHKMGGTVWHIHRGGDTPAGTGHVSATPLPVWASERELHNNDTIDRLYHGVDLLMTTTAQFVRVEPMLLNNE